MRDDDVDPYLADIIEDTEWEERADKMHQKEDEFIASSSTFANQALIEWIGKLRDIESDSK